MKKSQFVFTIVFITIFILLYFTYIITSYVIPEEYDISIILFIGFILIIIGFFYFFLKLIDSDNKTYTIKFRGLSENSLSLVFLILMLSSFFVPQITFSQMIVDWNHVSPLNYLRSIIFIIGSTFIPGSCLFNIFFSKSKLDEKLNVEPFVIKIVFYPILSFTFLGSLTLILDQLGLLRTQLLYGLFLSIIFLYLLNLLSQQYKKKQFRLIRNIESKISTHTIFILFICLSIIILTLAIQLSAKYIIWEDYNRAINYANFIGLQDTNPYDKFYTYAIYWSYIVFSISLLSGIPVVNLNVMLSPFIYLFVLSLYLFIKTFLKNFKQIYTILATILAVTFSSIFDIFNFYPRTERISLFVFQGLFTFNFKGFALILFFSSMALFMSIFKTPDANKFEPYKSSKIIPIIVFSTFLLIQSFMVYFIPIIPAISLIFLLVILEHNKRLLIPRYLLFMIFLIGFFISFDLIANFFFSYESIVFSGIFSNLNLFIPNMPFSIKVLYNAILIYFLLIGFLIMNFLLYKLYKKKFFQKFKFKKKRTYDSKFIFQVVLIFFTEFLAQEIIFNLIIGSNDKFYYTFFLHLFFFNIGFIGISGIYLSYYFYKKSRQQFYILLVWFIFIFCLSLTVILLKWFQYPSSAPNSLNLRDWQIMMWWFERIWYYSIIPLSMFGAIGLIKLKEYISVKCQLIDFSGFLNHFLKLSIISIVIVATLSNTIIGGIMWYDFSSRVNLNNEEARLIGWISKNTPPDSKILVDRGGLYYSIKDITLRRTYRIDSEIEKALSNYECWDVSKLIDNNCSIDLIDDLGGYLNTIEFNDQNKTGHSSLFIESNETRPFGEIQFFIKTSNKSQTFWINLTTFNDIKVISFAINSDSFYLYNGSIYQKLMDINNNTWYSIKINFECTDNNYFNLSKYSWKVSINGANFSEYNFINSADHIRNLYLATVLIDSDYKVYINNLTFSWAPHMKPEYCIFQYLIIFDHLRVYHITYFVFSKEETQYNKNAEAYIDIENELIAKFYQNKLYEYKYLALYSLIFH